MLLRPDDLEDGERYLAGTVAAMPMPADDATIVGPIAFALRARAEGSWIHMEGWVHASPRVPCDRCLALVRRTVDKQIKLRFQAAVVAELGSAELDAAELDVDYYPGEGIDLRTVLTEQVLLDIPMKVLCSEGCRGLCPQCGADRNRQPCDHQLPVDARLSPLADLRDRL